MSTMILKTLFDKEMAGEKHNIFLFPIGNTDLASQLNNESFNSWLREKMNNAEESYSRDIPIFKLWHLNGSMESLSRYQTLLTFYEVDEPTKVELNIAKNNKILFSSNYSRSIFSAFGVETGYLPLAFDSYNFKVIQKKLHSDSRITFNLCGKLEKRKNHEKVIQTWIKKFGGDYRYSLQCAVYNPFLGEEQNKQAIFNILKSSKPFNVNFFPLMAENSVYNEFLNSAEIIIGMSSGEGWGLPEFQSVALGKHSVILDAHGYKGWANCKNSVLVNPTGKEPCFDGQFFQKGQKFNQGNGFTWDEDEFIAACETAIQRVEASKVNENGLSLQKDFSKENFINNIISKL